MKKYVYSILVLLVMTSCSDIIEVQDITDDTVNLVAPLDNANLSITTLTLSWDPVEDATHYQVQIARPDFENILQLERDSTVTDNSVSVQLEAGNSYQWRVRAVNSDYASLYSTYSFTIE
ncbi:fibronectin type III domain-containing protein [Kordia sp.]|uniref:fibronectin type III domain-containing protein n=1 Tax=Kordia sp. TaxID=1965332 RepID=UPI003B5B6FE1